MSRIRKDEYDEDIIRLIKQGYNHSEIYRLINAPYWLNGRKSVISKRTINRRFEELRKIYLPHTVLEESTQKKLIELEKLYG